LRFRSDFGGREAARGAWDRAGRETLRLSMIAAYRTFDKMRQVDQGAITDNKRLRSVLVMIRDE
jgi:hypothetical protein